MSGRRSHVYGDGRASERIADGLLGRPVAEFAATGCALRAAPARLALARWSDADFLVIGGGIAGLSAAARLARHGRVLVLEAEEALGYHSSGRSVSFSHYGIGNAAVRGLTAHSRAFFERPRVQRGRRPLRHALFRRGRTLPALEALHAEMKPFTDAVRLVDAAEMAALCPVLRPRAAWPARPHRSQARRRRPAPVLRTPGPRAPGGEVRTGRRIAVDRAARRAWTVDGALAAPVLVNAAGAWADAVAALAGVAPLGLQPKRRTIIAVDPPAGHGYRRLAVRAQRRRAISTCCPRPAASSPRRSTRSIAIPATPSPRIMTSLSPPTGWSITRRIEVRRIAHRWAGLRTFTADRTPTAGFAPDAPGFFWLAGQGGYGLQTAPAMAEIVEVLVTGAAWPAGLTALGVTPEQIRPERLFA